MSHLSRILITVYFGIIILLSSLAVLLALRARWPRTAATLTLFLWLFVALTMLMGAGTHACHCCCDCVGYLLT